MDAQYENHRRRLAVHGIMVFFVGLILGIPFGLAQQEIADLGSGLVAGYGHELAFTMGADIADELQGDVRRWRIAHNQGLQHGFLLLALAAAIPLVRLTKSQLKVASVAVVVGAWGTVVGSTIAAIYEVNGRSFTPPLANRIAFVLLGIGVMGVLLGLAIGLLRAALDAIRGGLLGGRWFNWARNVEIRPRRLAKPTSLSQLKIEVADAYAAHMNVRAVGGGYSWSPMAITDGVMIDMSKLNQAIGDIVTNNDGTGEITVQAGMKMSELTDLLATRSLTLSTTTVIPMVQVGGALAMGCHGTGIHHPIFPELVSAMKVVNYQGLEQDYTRPPPLPAMPTPAELDAHKVWNALIVNLGALGIVYSLTFDCVPMFRVRAVDEIADMNTTLLGIKAIVQNNEYAEIFAFPFNQKCWVKTWNTTTDPIGPVGWPTARAGVQWLQNRILAPLLLHPLSLVPFLTPIVTKMFFSMVQQTEAGNRVMHAPDAMQYQTSFMRAVDLGHAIPVDPNYDSVRRAWYGVMDRLSALDADKIYAQNLVVHMRFVGKGSALLAPSSGNDVTCYIEILTFHNTTRYEEYFARIELAWMRLGGKPHWGKLVFEPDRVSELYDKSNLADFLEVRQRLDPEEVFVNPYLRRVLGLW